MRVATKEMIAWCNAKGYLFIKRLNYDSWCCLDRVYNEILYIKSHKLLVKRTKDGYLLPYYSYITPTVATLLTYILPEEWEIRILATIATLSNIITREKFPMRYRQTYTFIPHTQPYMKNWKDRFALVEFINRKDLENADDSNEIVRGTQPKDSDDFWHSGD